MAKKRRSGVTKHRDAEMVAAERMLMRPKPAAQVQRLRSILEKVRPKPKLQLEEAIEQNGFEDLVHD